MDALHSPIFWIIILIAAAVFYMVIRAVGKQPRRNNEDIDPPLVQKRPGRISIYEKD